MEQESGTGGGGGGSPSWSSDEGGNDSGSSSMDLSPPVLRGRGGRGRGRAVGRGRGRAVGRGRDRAVGRGRGRAVGRGRGRAVGALGRGVRGRGATVGPLSGRQCETPPSLPSSSDDSPTPSPPPLPRDKGTAHPNYGIVSPTSGSIDVVGGKWRKRVGTTALAHIYDGTPGIASPPPNVPSALELYDRFFTTDVWDLLVTETNRFAALRTQTRHSRPWKDTTVEELKAFIGILILMGIVRLPRLELYWSQSFPGIRTPGISDIMPLVRFEQLFRFLHLCDNATRIPYGQPGYDKLYKVRKLLDLVSVPFENEYIILKYLHQA